MRTVLNLVIPSSVTADEILDASKGSFKEVIIVGILSSDDTITYATSIIDELRILGLLQQGIQCILDEGI